MFMHTGLATGIRGFRLQDVKGCFDTSAEYTKSLNGQFGDLGARIRSQNPVKFPRSAELGQLALVFLTM